MFCILEFDGQGTQKGIFSSVIEDFDFDLLPLRVSSRRAVPLRHRARLLANRRPRAPARPQPPRGRNPNAARRPLSPPFLVARVWTRTKFFGNYECFFLRSDRLYWHARCRLKHNSETASLSVLQKNIVLFSFGTCWLKSAYCNSHPKH